MRKTAQFLVESVTLSLVGGAIGVSLGLIGSALVAQIADWPVVIEPAAVALAFGLPPRSVYFSASTPRGRPAGWIPSKRSDTSRHGKASRNAR